MLVGSLGAMEKMLHIITDRFQQGVSKKLIRMSKIDIQNLFKVCDDVMETAWSAMWNVTDETPINCERFLNGGGMYLFLKCKVVYNNVKLVPPVSRKYSGPVPRKTRPP